MTERVRLLRSIALAAIGVILAACGLCVQQAHADDVTLYTPNDVTLSKILEADPSIATNGQTFTFQFEAQDGTGTEASDAPEIADIVLTADSMGSEDVQYIKQNNFIPTAASFPHAGEWVYTVSETAASTITGITTASSPAQYAIRVYVENEVSSTGAYTGGLTIRGVTVERTVADQHINYRELKKVDPTVPAEGGISELVFTNVDKVSAKLEIAKEVTGARADRTLHFTYTMSVTIPEHDMTDLTDLVYTGTISGGDEHDDVVFTVPASSSTSNEATFTLRHGESLVVYLPTGTQYTVTEAGTPNYKARAEVTYADASVVFPLYPNAGSALTVDDSQQITYSGGTVAANTVSADNTSKALFTNERVDVTPTGIIISNLPFILLIGIPVVALVAWIVVRRRRRAKSL